MGVHGGAGGTGILDDAEAAGWSARVCWWAGAGEPFLMLSLPSGVFSAQTAAGRAAHAAEGPGGAPAVHDAGYLADVWGFTRCTQDGELHEIGDVPDVTLFMDHRGLTVEFAGATRLVRDVPIPGYEPATFCAEPYRVLGICFDMPMDEPDAAEEFLDRFVRTEAVLGQVRVLPAA